MLRQFGFADHPTAPDEGDVATFTQHIPRAFLRIHHGFGISTGRFIEPQVAGSLVVDYLFERLRNLALGARNEGLNLRGSRMIAMSSVAW